MRNRLGFAESIQLAGERGMRGSDQVRHALHLLPQPPPPHPLGRGERSWWWVEGGGGGGGGPTHLHPFTGVRVHGMGESIPALARSAVIFPHRYCIGAWVIEASGNEHKNQQS